MANPIIRIHDTATNIVTDREMTDAEFLQYETDKAKAQAQANAQTAKAAARQAVLDKLGLTADEAAALLGQFGNTGDFDRLRNNTRQHNHSQITRQKHDARQLQRA